MAKRVAAKGSLDRIELESKGPLDLSLDYLESGKPTVAVLSFSIPGIVVPSGLSRAEQEVVEMIASGMSNGQIASERKVSRRTVANQLRVIYQKLGVVSRAELVRILCAEPEPPSRPTGSDGRDD